MNGPRLIVYGNSVSGYRWRLVAGNNRIIAASSEDFATRSNAKRNARCVWRAFVRVGQNPRGGLYK